MDLVMESAKKGKNGEKWQEVSQLIKDFEEMPD